MIKAIKRQCAYMTTYQSIRDHVCSIGSAWSIMEIGGYKEAADDLKEQILRLKRKMDSLESKMWWITKKIVV